jgi:hypothetical protein
VDILIISALYPGLLAPSGWTDYGGGTGAGLVAFPSAAVVR